MTGGVCILTHEPLTRLALTRSPPSPTRGEGNGASGGTNKIDCDLRDNPTPSPGMTLPRIGV